MRPSRAEPTRIELGRHVDALAAEYSGAVFAEAVRVYADTLDLDARTVLGEVLLERAGGPELAIRERWEERIWFRRVVRRMSGER